MKSIFDPACRRCPRISAYLDNIAEEYPDYHAAPVPAFGPPGAALLIVGLAPGTHGANATGRPFTGDYAGILLYETLYNFGFASKPQAVSRHDGLRLLNCRITNAVKCVPPQNKPTTTEINTCNAFLENELSSLPRLKVVLSLGRISHNAVIKALRLRQGQFPFAHGAVHKIDKWHMVDSYHCSRYNTQTGRLTRKMFQDVFKKVARLL